MRGTTRGIPSGQKLAKRSPRRLVWQLGRIERGHVSAFDASVRELGGADDGQAARTRPILFGHGTMQEAERGQFDTRTRGGSDVATLIYARFCPRVRRSARRTRTR